MAAKKSRKIESPLRVGRAVFIRTVTHYFTGLIVALTKDEILMRDAAWIACTARFSETLATGALQEVEPYPGDGVVSVMRGVVTDVCAWPHALPRVKQ